MLSKRFEGPYLGTLCLIIQPLLLNVIGIPATGYIIHQLGATGYGQWATATTLIATVTFLTNLGLRMYFIRSIAQDPDSAQTGLAEQLGLRVFLGLLATAVAVAVALALRYPPVVVQCTAIAAVGLILTCAASALTDLLQATQHLTALAGVNLIAGLVLTAASVAVIAARGGPAELSLAYLLGPLITLALSVRLTQRRCCKVGMHWNLRRSASLLWQSRLMASQLGVGTVATQAEALLIPKLVGINAYGFFSAGWLLPSRLGIIPDAVITTFYPIFAQKQREGTRAAAQEVARAAVLVLGLCGAAAVSICLIAGPIARILFPEQAALCRQVMQISVWWLPLQGLAGVMGYALNAAGRERDETRLSISSNIASITVSAALILTFGLTGAAWATVCRGALAVLIRLPCVLRTFPPVLAQMPLVFRQGLRAAAAVITR
jgi:O-antigen/teichoic acid export membrane protein